MIEIKRIKADYPEFELVKEIRKTVFINEQGALSNEEFDRYDSEGSDADFLLLYDDGKAAGTARLVHNNYFKIGRIALLKSCRGKGYGALIVKKITALAFENGADKVLVDAQNYAVPFYEKIGFKVIGDEIIDRGLPHIPMCINKGDFNGSE